MNRFAVMTVFIFSCTEKELPQEDTEIEDKIPEETTEDSAVVEEVPVDPPEEEEIEEPEPEPSWDVCVAREEEAMTYALPAVEEEAPQLMIIPGDGESYLLSKEALSEGWFVLDVPSWMCNVELYTEEGVVLTLAP